MHDPLTDHQLQAWASAPDVFSEQEAYDEAVKVIVQTPGQEGAAAVGTALPLDRVRKEDVGSFKRARARTSLSTLGLTMLEKMLDILISEETFEAEVERRADPTDPRRDKIGRTRMNISASQLAAIMDWGMIERTTEAVRHACGLFTVPKANGFARLIYDGRRGNAHLAAPPYFTLFEPMDIVRAARALGTFSAVTCDVRHHFHRLKQNKSMASFYGIHLEGIQGHAGWAVPTVLCMGNAWAPAIGQAASWSIVAHRELLEITLGLQLPLDRIVGKTELIENGRTIGVIFVCIDNICIMCSSPKRAREWKERVERNAKLMGVFPFKEMQLWGHDHFEFIGVELRLGRWRHTGDRIERWRTRFGELEQSETDDASRHSITWHQIMIQRVTGVLVWNARARGRHMKCLREVFDALNTALKGLKLTYTQRRAVGTMYKEVLRNEWEENMPTAWPPTRSSAKPTTWIVTDASDTKWSWVECDADKRTVLRNPSGEFTSEWKEHTIYYKEFVTIVWALRKLDSEGTYRDRHVVLLGDNRAVIGSIKKRLAPKGAWELIDEVEYLVKRNEWSFELRWVESAGNVAHSATHDEPLDGARLQRSIDLMLEYTAGTPDRAETKRRRPAGPASSQRDHGV